MEILKFFCFRCKFFYKFLEFSQNFVRFPKFYHIGIIIILTKSINLLSRLIQKLINFQYFVLKLLKIPKIKSFVGHLSGLTQNW